jgi:hypothetical protein
VPPPEDCPPRFLPEIFRNTIMDKIEVRVAKGMLLEEMTGEPGRSRLRLVGARSGPPHPIGRHVGHLR